MITSSGIRCDVCGGYILLCDYEAFSCRGIATEMHCHLPKCKQAIEDAGEDWTKLPDGPFRKVFEEIYETES